jgi:hypothetical protein
MPPHVFDVEIRFLALLDIDHALLGVRKDTVDHALLGVRKDTDQLP